MAMLIILVIIDVLSQCSHMCRHPIKFYEKYIDKLSCSYLSVMFSCHLICTHLEGANHILLQKLNILSLVENSNWLSSITKRRDWKCI
jgi:hypothetical protein